ncbi:COLEC12 [Mytilus coruscus]|uniref:COLEC12 n=1 Tax=Mytilus coruscus TaxID=42192 RepID=A0A6J8ELT2_MYTCO|nr:COLEC12 [Mytilus coruscus]
MILTTALLFLYLNDCVSSIPCLSNESKKDFDDSRKTLVKVQVALRQSINALENNHKKTIKTLDNEIKNTITNMEKTIKMTTSTLEKQLGSSKDTFTNMEQKLKKLEEDFKVLGRDFHRYTRLVDISGTSIKVTATTTVRIHKIGLHQWHKYKGHCYYYGQDKQHQSRTLLFQRKCRDIGGYIAKINDQEENSRIFQHRPNTSKPVGMCSSSLINNRGDAFKLVTKCRGAKILDGYVMHRVGDLMQRDGLLAYNEEGLYSDAHYWIGLTDLKEGEWRWSFDQSKATYTTWISGYGSKGTGHNCVQIPNGHDGKWIDYLCSHQVNYICESNFCNEPTCNRERDNSFLNSIYCTIYSTYLNRGMINKVYKEKSLFFFKQWNDQQSVQREELVFFKQWNDQQSVQREELVFFKQWNDQQSVQREEFVFFFDALVSSTFLYSRSNKSNTSLLYGGLFATINLSPEWFTAIACGRRIPSSLFSKVFTNFPSFVST